MKAKKQLNTKKYYFEFKKKLNFFKSLFLLINILIKFDKLIINKALG